MHTHPTEPVLGLIFLGKVQGVVDEAEAGGAPAAELCLEPEAEDCVGRSLVHAGPFLPDLCLGHRGTPGMENVHHLRKHTYNPPPHEDAHNTD